MSFIKSIVKEINIAKSMLDIPALKQERDKLQTELSICNKQIDNITNSISTIDTIYATAKSLQEVSSLCFEEDDKQVALNLCDKMCKYCDELKLKLKECTEKQQQLITKIACVNDNLKKARANVK